MDRRVISLCLSLSLMLLIASCSGKKVVSSSGDVASQAGQTKSEEIRPDAIKTVPLERSFDRPSGSATGFKSARMPCQCWTPMPDGFAPMGARPC
jgi:hypothetical protein